MSLSVATTCFTLIGKTANAKTAQTDGTEISFENSGIAPRGIYTKLTMSVNGGNGQVWASVKNKFTLFPATVTVNLELYRSDVYQENYRDMTQVATNYIYDLDQGETIIAICKTNNEQWYWKARAYYKIDNQNWVEEISDTLLFNEYGIRIF